jgi:hypothetical protein
MDPSIFPDSHFACVQSGKRHFAPSSPNDSDDEPDDDATAAAAADVRIVVDEIMGDRMKDS